MLYVVSTPIGNLKDISFRAIDVLQKVHLIAAEDTRHTKILTNHYQINTPLTSCFEHNETRKADYLLGLLKEGKDVALVSDAGTPGISDPGYHLIRLAQENNIPMTVIPGACALVAALTLSGLPSDRFVFEGFLPVKLAARRRKIEEFKSEMRTIIFYESPYRVLKTLKDIEEILGDPCIVCLREISKKFEEMKKSKASELIEHFTRKKALGEFVFVLSLKSK